MKNNDKVTVTGHKKEQDKNKTSKGIVVLLIIVVLGLAAAIGVMLSKLSDQRKDAAEKQEIFESYRISLERDLTDLQGQFGELQTNNDSLMTLAGEQQERITRLLAIQADNTYRIRLYQNELETLRGVLRSFVVQIDSLNQSNEALRSERIELTRNLAAERTQRERITEERDRMTSTVQLAQILSAADIVVTGLNNRGRETPRVRNVDKLQICFTVRENPVAAAGDRIFYIVIIAPGNRPLTNAANSSFQMQNNEFIVYTDRRDMTYENRDIDFCIYTDNNGRLTEGNYTIRVYCDGYLVGSSTFTLR